MILWRKGLKIRLDLFYSLRNLGSWSKRKYIVTIASAACWSISDYNIDPQLSVGYFQNILRLTIIGFKKILKPTIPIFKKKAYYGTYHDHADKVLGPTIFRLTIEILKILFSSLHPQKVLRQYLTHRHVGWRAGSLGTVRAGAPRISPAVEDLSISPGRGWNVYYPALP